MRLRYLHLPRFGPLEDVKIVFGQQTLLYGPEAMAEPKRQGAINFIVGINGTGKSTILRAIYQTFQALKNQRLPPMPVTMAWEVNNIGGLEVATALFHLPPDGADQMVFLGTLQLTQDATLEHWERLTANAIQPQEGITYTPRLVGKEAIGSPALQAHLPSRLIAYTSGADTLWEELEQQEYRDIAQIVGVGYDAGDRPPGWSLERDWETEQPVRVGNAITQLDIKMRTALQGLPPGSDLSAVLKRHNEALVETIRPLGDLSSTVFENQVRRSQNPAPPVMRVTQADLRTAAVALALHQSAKAGPSLANHTTAKAERDRRIAASLKDNAEDSVEWVFNTVDWFQATHLSFTYRDADDRFSKKQTEQLLCLLALAGETFVLHQPLDRVRVVIRLLPDPGLDLAARLNAALPNTVLGSGVDEILKRLRGCQSGAEAVMKIFTENKDEAALNDVFLALRSWRESGLLEELNLTIQRLHPKTAKQAEEPPASPSASDFTDTPEESFVTYDLLSDGEQMLLARLALIHLLKGQGNSLLLLDEPETHFNDAWKRRLIDLVDDSILKETSAQVLVSTHTSLALTDVFSCEITRLVKHEGTTRAERVAHPTFGADPGRILLHVFGAPDVIGARAAEFLREKLRKEWEPHEIDKLAKLIDEIGSGWPRAKLMDLLEDLNSRKGVSHAAFDS